MLAVLAILLNVAIVVTIYYLDGTTSISALVGVMSGAVTITPGLAAADSMTDSPAPSVAYATVYPIAMVFLILFIQMIANLIV